MKILIFIVTMALGCVAGFGQGVEIKSTALPFKVAFKDNSSFQSRMMVEDGILYIPTSNGIYGYDLNSKEKNWFSQGFEGENILECIHCGEEWLAITRNQNMRLLLRSADNGKTVEDYTPYTFFDDNKYRTVSRLCQDPANPQVIYLISVYAGILKSTDFGKSWSVLTEEVNSNNTYCGFEIHPLDTDLIMQHAESGYMAPSIQISHNGGTDWIRSNEYPAPEIKLPDEVDYTEDCIHDIAFHPTDINTWVFGGEGVLAKTTDGGKTWAHKGNSWGYHYSTMYDNMNPDILYSPGTNDRGDTRRGWIFMISTDGGETWRNAYHYEIDNPVFCDMKQTENYLIILGTENLYFVKKNDLLALSSAGLEGVSTTYGLPSDDDIYSIQGTVVKCDAGENDLSNLPAGIYIYRNKKVAVK